jgi:DNA-binding NtrC family response regulator
LLYKYLGQGKGESKFKQPLTRILVIDDDKALHSVFTRILRKEGYDVETAETGAEALNKIKNGSFDVALIDVKLPDISGLDLLPLLKKTAPAMVKIMITGCSVYDCKMEALQLGADEFLRKPIPPPDLLRVIKEKLDLNREAAGN